MKKLLPFSSLLVVLSLIACLTKEVPQVLSSETFELTSKDGNCYRITLDRLYGNSIVFKKEKIICGEDAQNYRGIYDARATLIAQSEEGDGKYWYIPIDGDPQEVPGNPRIECFCEKQGNDDWGGCNGQGECALTGIPPWYFCMPDPCCDDCDARLCIDSRQWPIDQGGVLIKASYVSVVSLAERDGNTQYYYGNNVRIEITQNGNSITAHRFSLNGSENYPTRLFNLTSLEPEGNTLASPTDGLHWFIPFDLAQSARSVYGQVPHCVSDGCTAECEMAPGTSGCLECKCTSKGDCDLEPNYASGGVLVETYNLQILDN